MTLRPYLSPRSFWVGFYWSSRYRRLYILPLPCIGVTISFEKKKRRWWWFLSVLSLALAGCTAAVDPSGSGGHPSVIPSCHDQGATAEGACEAVTHDLESYGCTFSGACNASCPSTEGPEAICTDDIDACEQAAAQTLPGVAPADLAAACQSVETYCNSVLLCRPLN